MKKYNKRSDVPEKYKWDLTDFFADDEEFNKELVHITNLVKEEKKYIGCCKDADRLYEFLEEDSYINAAIDDLYVYAYLINDQELGISSSIERKSKTQSLLNEYNNAISFFNPELLKLSKKEYNELYIKNEKLKKYKSLLDKIYRNKDHILSEKEEQIVNNLVSASKHFDDMSSTMLNSEHDYGTIDIDGETVQIRQTNLRKILKNKNKEIRKEVYFKFNKVIDQYGTSSAQFLDAQVKTNLALAKIRGYKDYMDQALFCENLPSNVYKTLVEVAENNVDALQTYFKVFKNSLKLDELNSYDLNMDLASSSKEYEIEEAWDIIRNSLKPLGEHYLERFEKIINNRYIDYCEYDGKCSGGYSFSTMNKDSRILMSYNGNLDSISTIIHESGHNINHQFINDNNIPVYRYLSSIVGEVASLTNECLLSSYLAENGETSEEKKAGIANILEVIVSNFFGAIREAKMEQDFYDYVSNGGTITKDYMNNLTKESLEKYYGDTVKLNEYSSLSWSRRSHYYMSNFYLYSYAICISVASSVAAKILSGDKDMLDKYMEFLKIGSDVWPIDAMKVLGVDLEKADVYIDAVNYFKSLLQKFENIDKEV